MTPMETATVATAATAARPRLGAPKLVLLLGPPGSGKTMHAAQLAKRHHLLHLSTGAILRKYLDTDPRSEAEISPQRGALRKAVLAGELVSDDVIVKLLCDTLRAQLEPQQTLALLSPSTRAAACRSDASLSTASGAVLQRPYCGVILDGFPRTAAQAQMLLQHLRVPDVTLQLEVPPATLTQRLSTRGRADDTPATIRHRLAQYEATLPGIRAVLAPTVATSPVAAPTASRGASATTAMGARGGLLTVPAHDAPETVLSRLAHHVQSTLGPTPAFHPPTRAPAEVKPIAATATPASCERRLRPRWASRVRLAA
ncbi:hypothetical protein CXG81DRAFT_24902 [Caulochytrium protostelioides]|uniref:Adenylate kinase n=1 Tax=Caulochytrium protostelioides TaxID=1555241 RepID=A0A4P9XBG5_9FUNG|nr:hypothetical protein CXG81DRAFT_24902 [Caulochytrium protostelioides]|eukprot:RKP02441.1 hypothetical protein CXG81DRAFT_24902 [Caulochytrium protostelioides]